jgi:hypothetical protein
MKKRFSWVIILLTVAIFALPTLSLLGQTNTPTPAPDVFGASPQAAADANVTRSRGVIRARTATLNRAAVPDTQTAAASAPLGQLRLNLFPDVNLLADQLRTEANNAIPTGYVWVGSISGDPYSQVVLSVGGGQMAGYVQTQDGLYEIKNGGTNLQVITQLDPSAFDNPTGTDAVTHPPLPRRPQAAAPDVQPLAAGQTAIVDMLVVYTPAARNHLGGDVAMRNEIQAAITAANQSYLNSDIDIRMNLVQTALVSYTESGDMGTDLENVTYGGSPFQAMDNVLTLRDTYQADLVTLVTYDPGSPYCGLGWQLTAADLADPPDAFAPYGFHTVNVDCMVGNLTLAHEAGHNMGANHDIANTAGGPLGPYPYAYGYIDPAGKFRTVMSYNSCSNAPCPRVSYFSNITRTLNGSPLGNSSANNAQVLNNTASFVAAFRNGSTTPVSLTPTPVPPVYNPTPVPANTPAPGCNLNVPAGSITAFISAVNTANSNGSSQDVICLAPNSVYLFKSAGYTFQANATVLPAITTPITILGRESTLIWDGTGYARFFGVDGSFPQAQLTLDSMTLLNGRGATYAGAIYNFYGTLNLNNVTLRNNISGNSGGAIYNTGPLNITDSKFYGNSSVYGGAIYAASSSSNPPNPAPVAITRSLLQENDASYGSAIYTFGPNANVTATGSCFIRNTNMSIYNAGAPTLNLGTNWWNSSQGPTLYTGGTQGAGDRLGPSGITYAPFLTGVPPFCLTSPPAPPSVPVLTAPPNGSAAALAQPTFTWNASQRATAYEFTLGTNNPPTQIDEVVSGTSYRPSVVLQAGIRYYWRVRALGPGGISAWSSTFTLQTSNVPPLNYVTTDQPTLTWTALSWASSYQVQVATTTAFTTLEFNQVVSGATQVTIPPENALPEGIHYWRVRGCTTTTTCAGTWSTPQVLTVDLP